MDRAFDQKKADILRELNAEDYTDLSPKGSVDVLLWPLIRRINEHPDMVTTSSCSGRVSVFLEGTKFIEGKEKIGGKGAGGKWLYITHDAETLNTHWWNDAKQYTEETDGTDVRRYLLYKFEPLVLHVKCRNQETANKLYSHAMAVGFRESGIGSNCLVGIRISIRLDCPLGYLQPAGGKYHMVPIVNDSYIDELHSLSLDLFTKNTRRINDLHGQINNMVDKLQQPAEPHKETKDERRERKRREGLLRQQEARNDSNS